MINESQSTVPLVTLRSQRHSPLCLAALGPYFFPEGHWFVSQPGLHDHRSQLKTVNTSFFFFVLYFYSVFLTLHIFVYPPIHPPTVPIPPILYLLLNPQSPSGFPHPDRPSYSMGSQVSRGLGTSFPTEAKPSSPLLCVCQGTN